MHHALWETYNVKELKAFIKKSGLKNYSKMKRIELIHLMEKNASMFDYITSKKSKVKI